MAFLSSLSQEFLFILAFFYFVNSFQYFGDFLSKATPAGMGETSARSFSKQHKTPYCFSRSSRSFFEGNLLLDDCIFLWNGIRWFFKKTFQVKKPTLESTSENEEPSDSIGIIIAIIIDVNYWLWKLIS